MLVYVKENEFIEFYLKYKTNLSISSVKKDRCNETHYKSNDGITRAQVNRYCHGKKYLIDKGFNNDSSTTN